MGSQQSIVVNRTKSLDNGSHQDDIHQQQPLASSSSITGSLNTSLQNQHDRPTAQRSQSTLVVVNKVTPSPGIVRIDDDPLFKKLQDLREFVPLMYEAENNSGLFGNRALAEIRSKIDPTSFIQIVRLYEEKLRRHAESVNSEQRRLAKCIREIDHRSSKLYKVVNERDRKFTKAVGKFQKLNDVSHALSKCQMVMYECEQHVQILNGLLPFEDRLEPYEPFLKLDR